MTIIKAILLGSITLMATASEAFSDTAQLAFKAKNYPHAKSLFEKRLMKNENDVLAHLFLARIAIVNNKLDFAEEHVLEARSFIEKSTDSQFDKEIHAEVHFWFGSIMEILGENASIFSMPGYAKKSLNGYLKAVELFPTKLKYREALINFYLGAPSIVGGDIDEAIKNAKITFDQEPNFGFKMLVNCYEKSGESELMFATYKLAIIKYPLDAELLLMRGTYWKNERNYDKAISDYQLSLKLPATSNHQISAQMMSLYWIGRISGFNGDNLARGIDAYQQVIEFSEKQEGIYLPNIENIKFRMAKLMLINDQQKEAKVIFNKLLNSTKSTVFKKEIRKQLN